MEKEIIETTKELSPIIIAIITLLSGLLSGLITMFLSPMIKYKYEDKKKDKDYKIELIKNIRKLLDESKNLEQIKSSSYWGFIEENLSKEERDDIYSTSRIISQQYGNNGNTVDVSISDFLFRKSRISKMIARKEKEWKLLK